MKRAMVYLIAISALLTALLSGCGEMKKADAAEPTAVPKETVLPTDMMPEKSDGIVNDEDGIITEDDNGAAPDDVIDEKTDGAVVGGTATNGGTTGGGTTNGGTTGGHAGTDTFGKGKAAGIR